MDFSKFGKKDKVKPYKMAPFSKVPRKRSERRDKYYIKITEGEKDTHPHAASFEVVGFAKVPQKQPGVYYIGSFRVKADASLSIEEIKEFLA